MATERRFAFIAEYYDQLADLVRPYHFLFYPSNQTVELYDPKARRTFLKRSALTGGQTLEEKDLGVGAKVNVYSRLMTIVDYADDFTRQHFSTQVEESVCIVSDRHCDSYGAVVAAAEKGGEMKVVEMRMLRVDARMIDRLRSLVGDGASVLEDSNSALVFAVRGVGSSAHCQSVASTLPTSMCAVTSTPDLRSYLFQTGGPRSTAVLRDCTLLLIKPHAVAAGAVGRILDDVIGAGYDVSGVELRVLDRSNADDFLEVYRGVVPEAAQLAEDLCSGPVVALELRAQSDVVNQVRKLCGPHDPEIARLLRGQSLRAKYGRDRIHNAVHCTDLPDDGVAECEFFFDLLAR